ncbi:hypothetical protein GCM10008995_29280 [Halobellus salinus]|uniref:Uncharacterized protein n=1 Tax=Halobellus salinus TaxID=931585 RepID=A0A830ELL3_9EURY|nr:hypothetical protein [Halobellus salinus]GGJ17620.1 hypothetical protein GCM10008995_29280 [Halobellus salinus]
MTDDDRTPETGSTNGSTDDELLAERLEVYANRVSSDLHGLAADLRDGEDVDDDRVDEARETLLEADRTVRRRVDGAAEGDSRERSIPEFTDLYDVDYLAEDAPREEVAHKLAADVVAARQVADRVDRSIYAEELTDVDVAELWDYGLRLRGWAARVLSLRTDRNVAVTRDDPEETLEEENGHA